MFGRSAVDRKEGRCDQRKSLRGASGKSEGSQRQSPREWRWGGEDPTAGCYRTKSNFEETVTADRKDNENHLAESQATVATVGPGRKCFFSLAVDTK